MEERDSFEPMRTRSGNQPPAPVEPAPYVPYAPPPPPRSPSARRTYGLPVLAGVSLAALAIGVAAGWAVFHKPAAQTDAAPAPAGTTATSAATIPVSGSISLTDGWRNINDVACDANPARGYTDISAGTAVTIGDQTGQTIGIGALGPGKLTGDGAQRICQFAFNVTVPAGKTTYTVTISHRGTQSYTPAQVEQVLDVTLG